MKNMKKLYLGFALLSLGLGAVSCKKMLDLKPENLTLSADALKTTADAQALLNSCYDEFANLMNGSVQNYHELLGENINAPQSSAGSLYFAVYNRGTFSFRTADREYLDFYNCILRINTIFGRIDEIADMTPENRTRIEGEGYFLRAWSHWELVKLWAQPYGFTPDNSHAGVPIRLTADKSIQLRSTVAQVYAQILKDLDLAIAAIPESNGNYADKFAAKALKAKVLFLMQDYDAALLMADEVIGNSRYSFSDSFSRFAKGAPEEVVFQLISTSNSDNRGSAFINNYRSDNNPNPTLKPSTDFIKIAMQGHDLRSTFYEVKNKGKANEYFVCHKFDKDAFNVPLIHLSDLLLMRAECLAELGQNKTQAISDVDKIRKRAYGANWVALDPAISNGNLRDSARLQRRLEMAFEGDWTQQLRRMGAQGENIKIRTSPWNCSGMLMQFPASENTAGFIFNPEGGCN
jgi:hypothetical protein